MGKRSAHILCVQLRKGFSTFCEYLLTMDWGAIVDAHREIVKQGEEEFFTLVVDDSTRFWSGVDNLGEGGLAGPWSFSGDSLAGASFASDEREDVTHHLGIACIDTFSSDNGRRSRPAVVPLFVREVEVSESFGDLTVSPEVGRWSPTPYFFRLVERHNAGLFDEIEAVAARALERAAASSPDLPSQQLVDEIRLDFPQLDGQISLSHTYPHVLFSSPRQVSSFNTHLMRDYEALSNRLRNNSEDIGGLRVLERLGDVDPERREEPSDFVPLNPSQRNAVRAALGEEHVTVISGPPGCGKSQVVLSLLLNAWRLGIRTLFASTNNKAVDVVLERLERFESAHPVAVRAGSRRVARVSETLDQAATLIERYRRRTSDGQAASSQAPELRQRRERLQTILEQGDYQTIDELRRAALVAYGKWQETRELLLASRREAQEGLREAHPEFRSYERGTEELAALHSWLEAITGLRVATEDDRRRRVELQAEISRLRQVRLRHLNDFGCVPDPDDDLSWLIDLNPIGRFRDWRNSSREVLRTIPKKDLTPFDWNESFDRYESSSNASDWATRAQIASDELSVIAKAVSQSKSRRDSLKRKLTLVWDELTRFGLDSEIQVPQPSIKLFLKAHRIHGASSKHWSANIPLTAASKSRKQLDEVLTQLRDELPASFWAQLQERKADRFDFFLPIAELLERSNHHNVKLGEANRELEMLSGRLSSLPVHSSDIELPDLDLEADSLHLSDAAKILLTESAAAVAASQAWKSRELFEQTAEKIRKVVDEWRLLGIGSRAWAGFVAGTGQDTHSSLEALARDPGIEHATEALARLDEVRFDAWLDDWTHAREATLNCSSVEHELEAIPDLETRICDWWERRPLLAFGISCPAEVPSRSIADDTIERIHPVLKNWEQFEESRPQLEEKVTSERNIAQVELRRAAQRADQLLDLAIQGEIESFLENDVWALDRIETLFAQFSSAAIRNQIQSIDNRLEKLAFEDAKDAWLRRSAEDASGLEAIDRLSAAYRRGLKIPEPLERVFEASLRLLPIWVATGQSTQSVPLEPELFDLLVIDEASQCTVTNILPLLYRAKRLVVIGDRHQLPAIPNVATAAEENILRQRGLDEIDYWLRHNENDLYRAAVTCLAGREGDVHSLVEHYRSDPLIIGFSNTHIYGESLDIRTPLDHFSEMAGVHHENVEGRAEPHRASWRNRAEAEAVIQWAQRLLDSGIGDIGIISPFRAQKELIRELLDKQGMTQRVSVDTVSAFQGDERDAIIYSPVVAPGMGEGTIRWASNENLVNVAVTRPRQILVVVAHRDFCRSQRGIISDLVQYCEQVDKLRASSDAELVLFRALVVAGISCLTHELIGDVEVDFLIQGGHRRLIVEVDGAQHLEQGGADAARDAYLMAHDYQVYRPSARQVLNTPGYVVDEIRQRMEGN